MRWTADDAFISFRYAKNLAEGFGLVFNFGERVEGFTNFLWTILMVVPHLTGNDVVTFSHIAGIFFYAASFITIFGISWKLNGSLWTNFPLAAILFILHKHIRIFATAGLETSLFSFLILVAIYFSILALLNNSDTTLRVAALFLALAVMTRPDGVIFLPVLPLTIVLKYKDPPFELLKKILLSIAPFASIIAPYWIARWTYYGYFFPNTYYAKSGGESYWEQGFRYFWLYYSSYYVLLIIPIFIFYIFIKKQYKSFQVNDRFVICVLFLPAMLHILYFTRVGGDFMFSRFYITSTAILLIAIEFLIRRIWPRPIPAIIFVILFTAFPIDHYRGKKLPVISGISEEYKIYKRRDMEKATEILKSWSPVFHENRVRVAIGGSQAFFAYYLNPPYAFEATTGLTDEALAHKEIDGRRGLIGHEKMATLDDMRRRDIHLLMNSEQWPGGGNSDLIKSDFFPGHFRIITYDKEVIESLLEIEGLKLIEK